MFKDSWAFFSADGGGAGGGLGSVTPSTPLTPPTPPTPGVSVPKTWEEVLATLTPEVKALYEGHTQKLQNTVHATREERDALKVTLDELTKALGKNDPAEAKRLLSEMQQQMVQAVQKAGFMEEAIQPEIGCVNPRAAYMIAVVEGAFSDKGKVDWAKVRLAAPELFKVAGAISAPTPILPRVNPTNPANPPTLTLDAIRKMTTDEINKNWDTIKGVLERSK